MLISSGLFSKLSQRCIVFLASGARSLMSLEVFVLWFFFLCVFFFFFTTDLYKCIVCEWLSSILVPFQFGLLLLRIKTKLPSWFRSHWADVDQWSRWLLHHSFCTSLSLSLLNLNYQGFFYSIMEWLIVKAWMLTWCDFLWTKKLVLHLYYKATDIEQLTISSLWEFMRCLFLVHVAHKD